MSVCTLGPRCNMFSRTQWTREIVPRGAIAPDFWLTFNNWRLSFRGPPARIIFIIMNAHSHQSAPRLFVKFRYGRMFSANYYYYYRPRLTILRWRSMSFSRRGLFLCTRIYINSGRAAREIN